MNNEHYELDTIVDYLHRELPPERDAAVLAHLGTCTACRALYDDQAELGESLRAYARMTERELPPGVVARIRDAVANERSAASWPERFAAFLRPVYALPVAAALVVAAYFGVVSPAIHPSVATIDAAYYLEDHAALTNTVPFSEGAVVPASLETDETGSDQRWVAATGPSDIAETR